jgi:hypothetical protein
MTGNRDRYGELIEDDDDLDRDRLKAHADGSTPHLARVTGTTGEPVVSARWPTHKRKVHKRAAIRAYRNKRAKREASS